MKNLLLNSQGWACAKKLEELGDGSAIADYLSGDSKGFSVFLCGACGAKFSKEADLDSHMNPPNCAEAM